MAAASVPLVIPHSLPSGQDSTNPKLYHAKQILPEERFRLLVQGVTDYAIFLLDPEGRILCWNTGATRIFGYTEPDVIGQHYSLLFIPEDVEAGVPQQELKKVDAQGTARNDGWHVRKGGRRFLVRGTINAVRHENGNLLGYAKVVHDLKDEEIKRELRNRADGLLEANRLKGEFLAMLSHELRNPLTPILYAMHIMKQDQTGNPIQQRVRGMVERQVRHLARLLDDLLDVSRITNGKTPLRKERVELSVVVERAIESARPLIDSRNHLLTLSFPPQTVWVEADPIRLEQALTNLLNNAAKYTDPGGRIAVAVNQEGEEAVIRVRDNGVGVTAELLPRMFDLFIQSDRSLDRCQGGLGIGLTVVRQIVALHDGSVTAGSDGLGKGSEFIVRLPC